MSVMSRLQKLFVRAGPVVTKAPMIGDPVWYAPKRVGCMVIRVNVGQNSVVFRGGPVVKNKRGREVPRWTIQTRITNLRWNPHTKMFNVGEGPTPKVVRGQVVYPDPVAMSGQAQGSFAITTGGK